MPALGEIAFDIDLRDAEDCDDHHIPDGRYNQKFDNPGVVVVNVLDAAQNFSILNDACERGELHHADGFISDRGDDNPHRLWKDDTEHRLPLRHTYRLCSLKLAPINGEDTRANNFGSIRTLLNSKPA
ncbi:hypothetical protein D3C80_1765270 [compost metagenome]